MWKCGGAGCRVSVGVWVSVLGVGCGVSEVWGVDESVGYV